MQHICKNCICICQILESIGGLKEKTGKTSNAIFLTNLALRTQDISSFYSERVALQETKSIFTFKTYHWAKNRRAKKRVLVISQTLIRRGVRSDAQLSCTDTRFQKCSQSGKNGSKHPMLSISMACNVISCKKIGRNTQKIKIADFTM